MKESENKNEVEEDGGVTYLAHSLDRFFRSVWGKRKPKKKIENISSGKLSKEQIKFIIMQDVFIRAPLWALFIVAILTALSFFIIWFFNLVMNQYLK